MARTPQHDRKVVYEQMWEGFRGRRDRLSISIEELGKRVGIPRRTMYKIIDEYIDKGWVRWVRGFYYLKDPSLIEWESDMVPWSEIVQNFWECDDSTANQFLAYMQSHGWVPTFINE